jgi:hypothetical protein
MGDDEQKLHALLAEICEYLRAWHDSFDDVQLSVLALIQAVSDKSPQLAEGIHTSSRRATCRK